MWMCVSKTGFIVAERSERPFAVRVKEMWLLRPRYADLRMAVQPRGQRGGAAFRRADDEEVRLSRGHIRAPFSFGFPEWQLQLGDDNSTKRVPL